MTSPSSGYVTAGRNFSSSDHLFLWGNVSVPDRSTVMVSFKQTGQRLVDVTLFRLSTDNGHSVSHPRHSESVVWHRTRDFTSDFAQVFSAAKIMVKVLKSSCTRTEARCFQLFFSFFSPLEAPQKLPSGLWNCSVDHYASFHPHIACNHQTECEDGRDETEHCPFSSAQCQGLVAFCNSCYQFVKGGVNVSNSIDKDVIAQGHEYCNSLGAVLSFPMCMYDWLGRLKNITKMHEKRLVKVLLPSHSNDMSLPNIYRHELMNGHSVLYHFFQNYYLAAHKGVKSCYQTFSSKTPRIKNTVCFKNGYNWVIFALVCEFKPNKTINHVSHSEAISMASTHIWPLGPHYMTQCFGGHVTHTFLLYGSNQNEWYCKFSDQPSRRNKLHSVDRHASDFPLFICSDDISTLPYTLVCDFIADCADKSDESVCKHPLCDSAMTCTNGQCLPFANFCDQITHCEDESDEQNCEQLRIVLTKHLYVDSPALVRFSANNKFISLPMNSSESCPDSHYRCPGEYNDCLPVYTRCNGIFDCVDHQDEERCQDLRCPGFFRCRKSLVCIHPDHLCDDWSHCLKRDDELVCDVTCPVGCRCQGHAFLCLQPFPVTLFPRLRALDATGSGMTLMDVNNHAGLFHLSLARCSLTRLIHLSLLNLGILDLRGNKLQHINVTFLLGLERLQALSLSDNPLTSLHTDLPTVTKQLKVTMLDLSATSLTVLGKEAFSLFPRLRILNLTFTAIHTISSGVFQFTPQLTELYLDGSPIESFPLDEFQDLSDLQVISTQNHKLCCREVLPSNFDESLCFGPKDELSSCEDLLQSWTYRGFLWLITCLSVTGNLFCFCARLFPKSISSSRGFGVFVINLTMADFLMGVYTAIIGIADERFRGRYLHHDDTWKNSMPCEVAGMLSLLSSEVSALIIWFITLDRFLVLHFPFSSLRFGRTSASMACLMVWLAGWCLALLPLLPVARQWEFYSQTGICIPLPVTRQDFKGRVYSVSLLIILNFILFLFISAGQALIYWSIQANALKTNTTKMSRDLTIARRLVTVAVTDFMCWFPIGICGILASAGVPVPGEVSVALAIFILPLNSAVNPFMYTFNTLAEKWRKIKDAQFLGWLESHHDLIRS